MINFFTNGLGDGFLLKTADSNRLMEEIFMSTNYSAIAFHHADELETKKLCDEWQSKNWFSDYVIVEGDDTWHTVFDETLEWGNVDITIQHIFYRVKTTILSVEFYEDQVRYRLWKSGECFSEITIGESGPSVKKKGRSSGPLHRSLV